MYISVGDVSCQKLNALDLTVKDNVLIVEDIDEKAHKANCERSFTLLHRHKNCVITINMMDKVKENQSQNTAPINISNLENNLLE
jgi:acetone carboxylase gamma subunit